MKYTVEEVQAFASASAVAQEVLQNIRTVTSCHGQAKEEERFVGLFLLFFRMFFLDSRFAKNLNEARKIGIKKGFYVGLCQGFSSVMTYTAFAIIVWYGPYLSRTDCLHYSAGSVLVVS